jgi:hypothetical protein
MRGRAVLKAMLPELRGVIDRSLAFSPNVWIVTLRQ